ncbi:Predicted permease YjgP/YjgQ family [hydrothermal vent metagenome]|uniref:Predicted permease YjgP/YjgQ family n=1 Tax=hydrothermal vent metagenome TaxID=652676 RepID=A0A1W1D3T0_9ZZZZ
MNKLEKYIIDNIFTTFISIFLSLFMIASLVFLIKLATWTAVIKLDVLEMGKMYLFVLPEILFFILPITFFVSSVLALFRLSNDNEMVVVFALGIGPKFLLRIIAKVALFLGLLLLFDYLFIVPHTRVLSDNFYDYKKGEAQLNISASEYGHKFGDWLLYIGKADKKARSYEDIFLFNKGKDEEMLITAKKAQIINDDGILRLKLKRGEANTYSKKKFSQINFQEMYINDILKISQTHYKSVIDYWLSNKKRKTKRSMLITNTLLSLFPLLSIFLIVSIGVVHAREQKGKTYFYIFLSLITFFGLTLGLQKILVYYTIPFVMIVWFFGTYMIYKKTIAKRF